MKRSVAALVLSSLLVVTTYASTTPAFAWSNGVGGPDSYGTHDWVLHRAVKALGSTAGWVQLRVALRATDDCDTREGIDHCSGTWWHVWDETGATWGGAPEAARVWLRRTKHRLDEGEVRRASRALGYLAHIVGDVANPMHSDSSSGETDSVHSGYESEVDSRSERSDGIYNFHYDGADSVKPYGRTRAVAARSHEDYRRLVGAYSSHGYNARARRITRRSLDFGANAVADLIGSLRK